MFLERKISEKAIQSITPEEKIFLSKLADKTLKLMREVINNPKNIEKALTRMREVEASRDSELKEPMVI